MSGQVAPQGVHPDQPIVAGVEAAPPAGAVGAVETPVGNRGAIADGAQWGDGDPALRPGVGVAAEGARAAGGQVLLDQRDGWAGGAGGSAAVAGAVAPDVVDRAVEADEVAGPGEGHLGRGDGKGEGLAQGAADAGDDVGDHAPLTEAGFIGDVQSSVHGVPPSRGLQKGWLQLLGLGLLALCLNPGLLDLPGLWVGASNQNEWPQSAAKVARDATWQPNRTGAIFAGATDLAVGGQEGFFDGLRTEAVLFLTRHSFPFRSWIRVRSWVFLPTHPRRGSAPDLAGCGSKKGKRLLTVIGSRILMFVLWRLPACVL